MRNNGIDARLSGILTAIGENLTRKRGGMPKTTLAKESGVSKSIIEGLERGEGNPTLKNLVKLAEYLDVNITDFFLKEDDRRSAAAIEDRRSMENLITGQFLNLKFELMRFCEETIERKIKS